MKFYLTVEPAEKIKKTFINLNVFYILDVPEIISNYNLDLSKPSNKFMVNQEIENRIKTQAKSKRLEGIIYINPNLNETICDHIFNLIKDLPKMENMVLLDDQYFPKLESMHHLFEEVLFFPSVRRVKILECKTLKPFLPKNETKDDDTLKQLKQLQKQYTYNNSELPMS